MHTILIGKKHFDWAHIVSDNNHNQLITVLQTNKFFMTSYIIWVVARAGRYLGLKTEGRLGEDPGQKKVWE